MTSGEKTATLRELKIHLNDYRSARWQAALESARLHLVSEKTREDLGFHAIRLAECLARLGGSTR